mgnify:CR=1 FL=1
MKKIIKCKNLIHDPSLEPIQNGVIVVEGQFISEVGDENQIPIPENAEVIDCSNETVMPGLIMHFGKIEEGLIRLGDPVEAQVNKITRKDCARNHTATHMLHAALRQVLGDHVRQAGSLVAPERVRFDFTHVKQLTSEELFRVQQLVNDKIRQNFSLAY